MPPGTKPKPRAVKVATGNPGKRPFLEAEARIIPALPAPPHHLNDGGKAEWARLSNELYEGGLLTRIDRAVFAAYCQSCGRWERAEKAIAKMSEQDLLTGGLMIKTSNGNAIQNPLVGIANKAMADMVRYATELGMTPSARSRITATPPVSKEDDPTAEYLN